MKCACSLDYLISREGCKTLSALQHPTATALKHLPIILSLYHTTSWLGTIAGRAACQQLRAVHVCLLQVHVVELQLSREEALRRHQAAAAAKAAGLEVVGLGAEASQRLLGEASFMPQPQQPEDQVGSWKMLCTQVDATFSCSNLCCVLSTMHRMRAALYSDTTAGATVMSCAFVSSRSLMVKCQQQGTLKLETSLRPAWLHTSRRLYGSALCLVHSPRTGNLSITDRCVAVTRFRLQHPG